MNPYKTPYRLLDCSFEVETVKSQWDMTLIVDTLEKAGCYELGEYYWKDFKHGIVIVPARQNVGYEHEINKFLNRLDWCILILAGDEEGKFNMSEISHPNMKVWLMQPRMNVQADFYIGSGYTPHLKEYLQTEEAEKLYELKPLDWSFAGQINHQRRERAAEILLQMTERDDLRDEYLGTDGFTKGYDTKKYCQFLVESRAIPCPSGIQSPDSFRVYEALEAGCVPVADELSNLIMEHGYWNKVFNDEDVPFKVFSDYENFEGYICDVIREYPVLQNKVFAWWQGYKRRMVVTLKEQILQLSNQYPDDNLSNKITILIPTSPIAKHPSTEIIDQTITDLRKVLPDCEIIIGIDGVREEQEHYREKYNEYIKRLLWKTNNVWHNVVPVLFNEHKHQAVITRQLLKLVKTPTILFVEHDTALAPDFTYEFEKMVGLIEQGYFYTIRFHHEAKIPEEHNFMMHGVEKYDGVNIMKTSQWSQRPHLSSTAFYRDMMERYFTDESRTMIEDKVHGFPVEAYQNDGTYGWNLWRIGIYYPEGQIKRSYTTDGRGDDPKFEMRF